MGPGVDNGWRGPERPCHHCGVPFIPKHPAGRYCSMRCRERNRRNRGRLGMSRVALYERDNWTCHLCGGPVEDAKETTPLSPSFDHVIPLSDPASPGHVASNVRLAHHGCNARKGNRPPRLSSIGCEKGAGSRTALEVDQVANMPSKDKQAVTMRLRKELVADVQQAAAEREETMTMFVVKALEDALSKHRADARPDDGCIATSG